MRLIKLGLFALMVMLGWNFSTASLCAAEELTIDSAIEALADEDAGTRKKAEDFLRAQGDKAIPALKKASEAADPEIRKRAAAFLTIAKRGPIVVKILDQEDKPVAGAEFTVLVFKAEEGKNVYAYGEQVYFDNIKPLVEATLKTSAEGVLKTEEVNQDDYAIVIKAGGDFPVQTVKQDISIKEGAKPAEWKIFRGSSVTLKVVDENDKPLADTAVFFPEMWGDFSSSQVRMVADRKLTKRLENYTKDSAGKTDAQGVVTFKKLHGVPASVLCFHAGYARQEKTGFKLVDGGNNDLGTAKLVPIKNGTVKIALADKDKKPLKGMTVIIVEADQRNTLMEYVVGKQLTKVLDWKFAHSAGPSDDAGRATASLPPGEYAFAVAHGDTSSLVWVSTVENGADLDCGMVVLP